MKSTRPLNVVFYRTATGNEPVREWLKSLPTEERKTIGADILSAQYAWPVGKPLVDEEIVLLHGFIKKQQQTPQDELALAKKRKNEYLRNL
jgi:phage-related protein